jgi:hypothetical protein
MRITYHLDAGNEKMTNFKIAEAIIELCDEGFNNTGLDAEVVAKMILLEIDKRKVGADNGNRM